jgi:hypothetical protein
MRFGRILSGVLDGRNPGAEKKTAAERRKRRRRKGDLLRRLNTIITTRGDRGYGKAKTSANPHRARLRL